MKLGILVAMAAAWVVYLLVERILLERARERIPLRVAVGGTRGKTSVTRMLASVLRESGRTVVAKTTGSEAAVILPDGSERRLRRRGPPSILEQRRLVHEAARAGADVLVAEIMSVHQEMHEVEAQRLLRPHQVVMTNFRVDHTSAQGETPEDVGSVLASDVPPGATVFLPEAERVSTFDRLVAFEGGRVVLVPAGFSSPPAVPGPSEGPGSDLGFSSNSDLVFAVARKLEIDDETIRRGIRRSRGDLGSLSVWRYPSPRPGDDWLAVNAFGANDPESTLRALEKVRASLELPSVPCLGVLALRKDRGDRSIQWANALRAGAMSDFARILVCGFHAKAFRFRVRESPVGDRVEPLSVHHPEGVMRAVAHHSGDGDQVVFGFGNIGGLGRALVDHWRKVGDSVSVPAGPGGEIHGP
jgi:poly-gamma-glutamate synthase PgsB/CapB